MKTRNINVQVAIAVLNLGLWIWVFCHMSMHGATLGPLRVMALLCLALALVICYRSVPTDRPSD